jgi:hypothetical protein
VFLLKEVFEYEHAEIAEMLEITPANARQIFHRAKARVAEGRPRLEGTPASRRAVAERFAKAFQAGDRQMLADLLEMGVGLWSDGGGKVPAGRRPLSGRDEVLNFLLGIHRIAVTTGLGRQATVEITEVNHEAAAVIRIDEQVDSVYVFSIDGGSITAIRIVRNPDKLSYVERQLTAGRPTPGPNSRDE